MTDSTEDPDTTALLHTAVAGDQAALGRLLDRYRPSLRRMVAGRLDSRIAVRQDPSDILQEAFADAWHKLATYTRDRPIPFYPWLRRLAEEKILQARRKALAQCRTPRRERHEGRPTGSGSDWLLADRLISHDTSACGRIIREETHRQLLEALDRLSEADRQVLVLRYLGDLGFAEIASTLGITENAAKVRHFRALVRVREVMDGNDPR
ncbi:sigma-70 family RNA polymerase sigma factor [Tundrisphaera lichenicola]|uniref:sigma-70 family RNA polymerase sigma factor n=1 Tax=Tundrisphaera lichenicola TaxID=2029860 RepID=UPI003EBCB39B